MEFCSKLSTTKVILCRESAVFLRGTSQPFMVLYLLAHPTPMLMFAVLFHFMNMTPHANYALMSLVLTCTMNEDDKKRLPVLGSCNHVSCLGCVLKWQRQAPKVRGRLRGSIDCMNCRKPAAFCPSKPQFHRFLIDLLSRNIPVSSDRDLVR